MEDPSGDFSDDLDEFEESVIEDKKHTDKKGGKAVKDRHHDEEFEVSQELSMAESFDGRDKQKERVMKNNKFDYAVEVSQSMEQSTAHAAPKPKPEAKMPNDTKDTKDWGGSNDDVKGLSRGDTTKSKTVLNGPFDEALEFSQSGSDESTDTTDKQKQSSAQPQRTVAAVANANANAVATAIARPVPGGPNTAFQQPTQRQQQQPVPAMATQQQQQPAQQQRRAQGPPSIGSPDKKSSVDGESEEEDHEASYDHIEGAYNPRDFQNLPVTTEVKELFMYITRYKPQEVDLDTPLKCFIPEYIPAIGELDPFLKVPRPDGKEDGSGLKYIDEPASNQSDPTVLELQLRAKSKKLQYGDVVVRSIENAEKNPIKVEKWIQDINELHRSKPPPHVNYRKNMPEIDNLMEVWPEDFERLLAAAPLPSPDLDLSIAEYAKVLCSLLDIPTYDNPIESLHLMFSLFIEFKNNPHFQGRLNVNGQADAKDGDNGRGGGGNAGNKYGGADVLEITD
jgi:intraflagellar transport protein 46